MVYVYGLSECVRTASSGYWYASSAFGSRGARARIQCQGMKEWQSVMGRAESRGLPSAGAHGGNPIARVVNELKQMVSDLGKWAHSTSSAFLNWEPGREPEEYRARSLGGRCDPPDD